MSAVCGVARAALSCASCSSAMPLNLIRIRLRLAVARDLENEKRHLGLREAGPPIGDERERAFGGKGLADPPT